MKPDSNPIRFSRIGDVLRRYGKRRSTLYDEIKRGAFPAPIRIGPRQSAWREDDLVAWERSVLENGGSQ